MEIWHRITFGHKDSIDTIIEAMDIKHKRSPLPGGGYLIHIDVSESDPLWPRMEELVRQKNALDIFDTVFTSEEILSAGWLRLIPVFEQGYPQPEGSWTVNPITYEGHCPECGVYEKQRESFRIRKEPRLGKNEFMTLYWTYALFTTSTVLSKFAAHQIRGYEVWDVLIHKTGQPSESISQVYIPHLTRGALIPEETLKRRICSQCGTTKYFPHMRGYMQFSLDLLETDLDFVLSKEWFGDGHAAYREILVSDKVARLVLENKWRGVKLKAIKVIS